MREETKFKLSDEQIQSAKQRAEWFMARGTISQLIEAFIQTEEFKLQVAALEAQLKPYSGWSPDQFLRYQKFHKEAAEAWVKREKKLCEQIQSLSAALKLSEEQRQLASDAHLRMSVAFRNAVEKLEAKDAQLREVREHLENPHRCLSQDQRIQALEEALRSLISDLDEVDEERSEYVHVFSNDGLARRLKALLSQSSSQTASREEQ